MRELAKALNDSNLLDLGDYLVSTEIYSSQIYWQIKQSEDIYSSPYKENGVVGILWETKVDYATFFGLNVEYIYGIQMLPSTNNEQKKGAHIMYINTVHK